MDHTEKAIKDLNVAIENHHVAYIGDTIEAIGGVDSLQRLCHGLARHSGWWDGVTLDATVFASKLALIHSEVSEALEGNRKNLMDSHLPHRRSDEVELADAVIRIFDLAGAAGMDLAGAIIEKLAYNQRRVDHTREHRASENGKKI